MKVSKRGEAWGERKGWLGEVKKIAQLVSDRVGIRTQECPLSQPLRVETLFSDEGIPLKLCLKSSTKVNLR